MHNTNSQVGLFWIMQAKSPRSQVLKNLAVQCSNLNVLIIYVELKSKLIIPNDLC